MQAYRNVTTLLPLPHGFMGELEAAQQKHLRQIPQAQFVQQPTEHDLEHNVGRQLEEVEWSTRALIGFTPTPATAEYGIAEFGATVQLLELGRLAMRTEHERGGGTSG